jgi:hypothetical protein
LSGIAGRKIGIVVPDMGHERAKSLPLNGQPSKWAGKLKTPQLPMMF